MLRFYSYSILLITLCLLVGSPVLGQSKKSLHFVPNHGQFDSDYQFIARTSEGNVRLKTSSIQFELMDVRTWHDILVKDSESEVQYNGHILTMSFLGANSVKPAPIDSVKTKYHYYIGNESSEWKSNVHASSKVIYQNLYDGIDLLVYSLNGNFKYDFKVQPGADPSVIQWKYTGISPELDENGDLLISTKWKTYREKAPLAYQLIDNNYTGVEINYLKTLDGFSFNQLTYDPSQSLTIDPELVFSTNSHITVLTADYYHPEHGSFMSEYWGGSYPASDGAFTSGIDDNNAAITKVSANGQEFEWTAILGGSGITRGHGLSIKDEELYTFTIVTGTYPTTEDVYQNESSGWKLGVTALSLDGSSLLKSTVFSIRQHRPHADYLRFNPLDPSLAQYFMISHTFSEGNIILAFIDKEYFHQTNDNMAIPTDQGYVHEPYSLTGGQGIYNHAIVVVSMSEDLTNVNYIHLINSNPEQEEDIFFNPYGFHANDDYVTDIITLDNGNLALCGFSRLASMPTTPDTFQPEWGEETTDTLSQDAWLAILEPSTGDILHASYLGGSGPDDLYMLQQVENGDLIAFGRTLSPELDPTEGALNLGTGHLFVARIAPDLNEIHQLARIGNLNDTIQDLTPMSLGVDKCDRVLIALQQLPFEASSDPILGFPLSTDAIDLFGSNYFALLSPDLDSIQYSTYYGGASSHSSKNKNFTNGTYFHITCGQYMIGNGENYIEAQHEAAYAGFDFNSSSVSNISAFKFEVNHVQAGFSYELLNNCAPAEVNFIPHADSASYTWVFPNETFMGDSLSFIREFEQSGTYPVQLITSREGSCNSSDTLTVMVEIPELLPQLVADLTLTEVLPCEFPQTVTAQLNAQNQTSIIWTLPDNSVVLEDQQVQFTLLSAGDYAMELTVEDNVCDSTVTFTEEFNLYEPLSADWDLTIEESDFCSDTEVSGEFIGSGQTGLEWYLNGELVSEELSFYQLLQFNGEAEIILTAQNENCNTEASFSELFTISTSTVNSNQVVFPNVFSPNADEYNTVFRIAHEPIFKEDFKSFDVQIYDRWGGLVFTSTTPDFKWNATTQNGNELNEGVYFYKCQFQLECGNTDKQSLSGSVTLLR